MTPHYVFIVNSTSSLVRRWLFLKSSDSSYITVIWRLQCGIRITLYSDELSSDIVIMRLGDSKETTNNNSTLKTPILLVYDNSHGHLYKHLSMRQKGTWSLCNEQCSLQITIRLESWLSSRDFIITSPGNWL